MNAEVFLDTNVLVYKAIGTGGDEPKRHRALTLIESKDFGTSAQVLQEFFVTVAAILSAARAMGPHTVYSEDLNSDQQYGGVRVVNPFATRP